MSFEKWKPKPDYKRRPASATIVQSRLIRLSGPVAEKLNLRNKPGAHLYYDKKRKVIGIRPSEKKDEAVAKVRQSAKSTSIHVPTFFEDYDIEVNGIRRFRCWWDDKEEMAVIDISKPSRRGRPVGS
ncbi:MAG: hypothetical protein KY432_00400 [Acidobacteria bacterium]|nr:hypothetical protein [Acidobacteriota bacterium]